MKRILLPASIFPTLVFVSCQKEITGDKPVQLNCKISKGQYVQTNGVNDSAQFIYDDWGRVIKWKDSYGYYDYLYSGSNIQALTFKNNGTSDLLYLDSVIYNMDNSISEIRFYDYTQLPYNLKRRKAIFIYDQNRVSSIMKVTYEETNPDTLVLNFTWNTQGNVDRIVSAAKGGIIVENITFQYNNSPNYFRSIHPQFFLFDPQFGLGNDFEWQTAFYLSQNSVTQFNRNGSTQNLVYYFNNLNQLTEVDLGSNKTNYSYQCQ
jgi:hypothetical protein